MFAQERRQQIADELRLQGRVEVGSLARRFAVAEETIRRDLRWLEKAGLAVRTHGGALLRVSALPPLAERKGVSPEAKRAIGVTAAALIRPGESVAVDSGSTGLEIARSLRERQESSGQGVLPDIHVVTNSLVVSAELATAPRVSVTVLGGTLRPGELCLVGPETMTMLAHYHFDKAFVSCAGLDLERGVAAANPFEAEVKQAMLRCATERIVVADASKLGSTSLVTVAELSHVDMLITDTSADPSIVSAIRAFGIRVEQAVI